LTFDGLSSNEARQRLEEYGPNLLAPESPRATGLTLLIKALTDPMALLLIVAAPTYVVLGDYSSAVFTALAIIPVAAIDVFLEYRAESALQKLRQIAAPTARVIRDGQEQILSAQQVVPGDIIDLQEGDVVPADAEIVQGDHLLTNEAVLTGESATVEKSVRLDGEERVAFAGTPVVAGQATARVIATGPQTRFGRISSLVATVSPPQTPLQTAVRSLVKRLSVVAAIACGSLVIIQLFYGKGFADAILAGVSLAIAIVPEEFSIVFTLYLGLGAWRLTRENALVRRLAGVETLGSTSVICADKTGTLTRGELRVTATETIGAAPQAELLLNAALACEARPFDPLDLAILKFAADAGVPVPAEASLVRDYPFDPYRKYLTHVWQTPEGLRVAAKGAIEGILAACKAPAEIAVQAHLANEQLAREGVRVIAVAGCQLAGTPDTREADEACLKFLGLVGFTDPVREGVPESLATCRLAGIRVLMITGDHPVTAAAVANSLGLGSANSDEMCSGDDLDLMADERLAEMAGHASVFARIRPEQKYRIVQALRDRGEVVAMTGDGVNDAPALREADIGVAMGERGTAVASEAATLVLLDDNFSTIITAVREGRRIFANLQRAFLFLIGFHIPVVLVALVVPLLNQPLLLTPVNLILLEIILHPTVSLLYVNDPLSPTAMREPPRPRTQGFIRLREVLLPALAGLSLTAAVTLLYLWRLGTGDSSEAARASAFITLIVGQLFLALALRSPGAPMWKASYRGNRALPFIVAGTLLIVAVIGLLSPARELMALGSLEWQWWVSCFVLAAVSTLWTEPVKGRIAKLSSSQHSPSQR
jgi:Ca2+-transporting ATPase